MPAALSPVGALARAADYDRYLSALFAPVDSREALFALIAFNHEVARIPEAVSEPMLGRIRLQWWREVLEAVDAGEPARRHEVAVPLADAIRACSLDRAPSSTACWMRGSPIWRRKDRPTSRRWSVTPPPPAGRSRRSCCRPPV